jgi:hypothetical protein
MFCRKHDYINVIFVVLGILFHYNKLTKEIIGNGIKISDIRYAHISLPKPNSDVVKLEEQRFINSDVSNCEVNINYYNYEN